MAPAPLKISWPISWRYQQQRGWRTTTMNTDGMYYPLDHPVMLSFTDDLAAARESQNIDKRLVLIYDELCQQKQRSKKRKLMKRSCVIRVKAKSAFISWKGKISNSAADKAKRAKRQRQCPNNKKTPQHHPIAAPCRQRHMRGNKRAHTFVDSFWGVPRSGVFALSSEH